MVTCDALGIRSTSSSCGSDSNSKSATSIKSSICWASSQSCICSLSPSIAGWFCSWIDVVYSAITPFLSSSSCFCFSSCPFLLNACFSIISCYDFCALSSASCKLCFSLFLWSALCILCFLFLLLPKLYAWRLDLISSCNFVPPLYCLQPFSSPYLVLGCYFMLLLLELFPC